MLLSRVSIEEIAATDQGIRMVGELRYLLFVQLGADREGPTGAPLRLSNGSTGPYQLGKQKLA